MVKYEFKSAQGHVGDPLIKLVEGQEGIVDFLLITQERDWLYFNLRENKTNYSYFDVTEFGRPGFPPTRLMHFDDETLRNLSQSAKIPFYEIVEILDIERANWQDVIKYSRVPAFYK